MLGPNPPQFPQLPPPRHGTQPTSPPWLHVSINPQPPPLPQKLTFISTPLNHQAWQLGNDHPDQVFASYLLDGIANGFRIGFAHESHLCTPPKTNHPSVINHPTVISEGLQAEVDKGRLIGPLNPGDFPCAQISSLGAVEKKHSTKWRLILDLSYPAGCSVNDGIANSPCSLKYSCVSDAIEQILRMGKGC